MSLLGERKAGSRVGGKVILTLLGAGCRRRRNLPVEFTEKDQYKIGDLLTIVALLRSENGCPWDKEQTHESVRRALIEEVYEAADAIDQKDPVALREELGDVLLEVVFHTQIETEQGGFTFDDICDGVCKKLIYRHPHIFGDVSVSSADEVLENWDRLKRIEKGQTSGTDTLYSVPKAFPGLMRAEKVQKRAAKAGWPEPDVSGALTEIAKIAKTLDTTANAENQAALSDAAGALLFWAAQAARLLKVDPEAAVAAAVERFIHRFAAAENLAVSREMNMATASLEERQRLWEAAGQGLF